MNKNIYTRISNDGKCILWDTQCPNISNCLKRNCVKIINILKLKDTYEHKQFSKIVMLILSKIQNIFLDVGVTQEKMRACNHFFNNGIGPILDNSFIDCDNKIGGDNTVIKIYIANIFRLEKIYKLLKTMPKDSITSFADDLFFSFYTLKYNLTLSQIFHMIEKKNKECN